MRRLLAAVEYALRLAFFAGMPPLVVWVAELVPMWATFANLLLALAGFFFGEVLRRRYVDRGGLVGKIIATQLDLEAFYRDHPPRSFFYYLAFPALFPYWLSVREARRELWLFKGYTLFSLVALFVSSAIRFFFVYRPELGVRDFVFPFAVGAVIETVAVVVLLMPTTTTIVALHARKERRRLLAVLAIGLVATTASVVHVARRRHAFASLETRWRVERRTRARPALAEQAMTNALRASWKAKRGGERRDGVSDEARAALEAFYRSDEASAFEVWAPRGADDIVVLFADGFRRGHTVFLGMRSDGTLVHTPRDFPAAARRAMRTLDQF